MYFLPYKINFLVSSDDALDHSKHNKGNYYRGAAVAYKRQRDSGNGQDSQVHSDINKDMEKEHRKNADYNKHPVIVPRNYRRS